MNNNFNPTTFLYSYVKEILSAKGTTEIVNSKDRQYHGQQNKTKEKHRTHNTTLEIKAGVKRTLQTPG